MPLASRVVSGLLNLRGQIVTAIDLRRCLDSRDRPAGQRPVHVILRTDDGPSACWWTGRRRARRGRRRLSKPPPRTLRGRLRELIRGAYKLDDGLLLVLDTERALTIVDQPAKPRRLSRKPMMTVFETAVGHAMLILALAAMARPAVAQELDEERKTTKRVPPVYPEVARRIASWRAR